MLLPQRGFEFMASGVHTLVRVQENQVTLGLTLEARGENGATKSWFGFGERVVWRGFLGTHNKTVKWFLVGKFWVVSRPWPPKAQLLNWNWFVSQSFVNGLDPRTSTMLSLKISQNLGLAFYLGCMGAGGGRRLNSYGELGTVNGLFSLLTMILACLSIWGVCVFSSWELFMDV